MTNLLSMGSHALFMKWYFGVVLSWVESQGWKNDVGAWRSMEDALCEEEEDAGESEGFWFC